MTDERPLIIDVKRHAIHDGPGIRTTVFFKGCPLNCLWCHNPEAISPDLEIGFYPDDCIACGKCAEVCPNDAIQMDNPDRIDRALCQRCGKCADACPGTGLRRIGTYYELDQLVELLLRDRTYYEVSGGGVTLSGGEPTLYMDYAGHLLRRLKEQGIHTTIQTAGCFDYAAFQTNILPFVSLILYDIKLMDPQKHRVYTGSGNRVILENFRRLIKDSPAPIIPRIPLIPGITATSENLQAISDFLQECGLTRCWLLPYNPLGLSKRKNIGKETVDLPQKWMSEEERSRCEEIFFWVELVKAATVDRGRQGDQ